MKWNILRRTDDNYLPHFKASTVLYQITRGKNIWNLAKFGLKKSLKILEILKPLEISILSLKWFAPRQIHEIHFLIYVH